MRVIMASWAGYIAPSPRKAGPRSFGHFARLAQALGNDRADALAKYAVADINTPAFASNPMHADAVQLRDVPGTWVLLLDSAIA